MANEGKKRRGPAPKPAGEKAEQVSIRLSPKLKLGLELLSRAQRGRSLSQVVEWAVQRGLNSVHVGPNQISIGSFLEVAWDAKTEWGLIKQIEMAAPELLDFKESKLFEAISNSREQQWVYEIRKTLREKELHDKPSSPEHKERLRRVKAVTEFVESRWEQIKEHVDEMDILGIDLKGHSLARLAGERFDFASVEDLEQFNRQAHKPA